MTTRQHTVDHDAYLERLLGALRRPDEHGIATDEAFGSDVRVQSLAVGHGPHGPRLEVTFNLARTTAAGADGGVVRLAFGSEWLGLNGYHDPVDYAPTVAWRVEQEASRLTRGVPDPETVRAELPDRASQWRLLLDGLGRGRHAEEVRPGRVQLRSGAYAPGVDRDLTAVVTVVATAEDWEDVLARSAWPDVTAYLEDALEGRDPDERWLVVDDGELVWSVREQLPPVRGRGYERLRAAVLQRGLRTTYGALPFVGGPGGFDGIAGLGHLVDG